MHTAMSSTIDSVLAINTSPESNEASFERGGFRDNRTGVVTGSMVGSSLLTCDAKHVGTSATSTPTVQWIRNGEMIMNTTGFVSNLEIMNFVQSDVGEYQCIYTDTDTEGEIITTIPFRLDTGMFSFCMPVISTSQLE